MSRTSSRFLPPIPSFLSWVSTGPTSGASLLLAGGPAFPQKGQRGGSVLSPSTTTNQTSSLSSSSRSYPPSLCSPSTLNTPSPSTPLPNNNGEFPSIRRHWFSGSSDRAKRRRRKKKTRPLTSVVSFSLSSLLQAGGPGGSGTGVNSGSMTVTMLISAFAAFGGICSFSSPLSVSPTPSLPLVAPRLPWLRSDFILLFFSSSSSLSVRI